MRQFKFLVEPLLNAHDGGDIYPGQEFYTVNKEELHLRERPTPKYSIVRRVVPFKYRHKFKPDHDILWYFRSKSNAEYLINIWKRDDRMTSGGESMHYNSDITITFNR
jgi:hypothetical protein